MVASSRKDEIEIVVAASRPYLDLPIEDLELLFEEALDEAELSGLPHRGTSDRSSWRQALDRLKKDIAEQGAGGRSDGCVRRFAGRGLGPCNRLGFDGLQRSYRHFRGAGGQGGLARWDRTATPAGAMMTSTVSDPADCGGPYRPPPR